MTPQPSEQPRQRPIAPHGLPSPDGRFLWDAAQAAWVPKETWREAAAPDPVASPAPLDPYDMRIMVRALYTSGLTDEMNPSDRRKAALRLRATLQEQSARLAGQPVAEEPA